MSTTIKRLAFAQTSESVAAVGGYTPEDGIYLQTTTITEVEWGTPGETAENVDTDVISVERLADDAAFVAALNAAGWQIMDGIVDHDHGSVSAIVESKN